MSTTPVPAPSNRKWKFALVAAVFAGALFGGALGTAWAAQSFPDVPPGHTFFEEVEWGAQHGIINGFPDGTFRPNQPVTRGQAATFLSHYNDAIHTVIAVDNPTGNTAFSLSAFCPVGERTIGGVGSQSTQNLFITDTYINGREFRVRWETDDNATIDPLSIRVTAVCIPDPAGSTATAFEPTPDKSGG